MNGFGTTKLLYQECTSYIKIKWLAIQNRSKMMEGPETLHAATWMHHGLGKQQAINWNNHIGLLEGQQWEVITFKDTTFWETSP